MAEKTKTSKSVGEPTRILGSTHYGLFVPGRCTSGHCTSESVYCRLLYFPTIRDNDQFSVRAKYPT